MIRVRLPKRRRGWLNCGAFELDQRGDLVIELLQLAPTPAPEVSDAAGELESRAAIPLAHLTVALAGLAALAIGIYSSMLHRTAVTPPVSVTVPIADPCRQARESIVRSNPFLPVSPRYTLQTYEVSEQEWYALANCRPVESTARVAKADITAHEAATFCAELGGALPSIDIWKAAYACATRRDAPCGFVNLGDGVEEFTSDVDETDPSNPLVYVIGGSVMRPKDPTAPRRIPANHSGSITGVRCARTAS
jgi:hypothetical protein